jgi:hypothetical protein
MEMNQIGTPYDLIEGGFAREEEVSKVVVGDDDAAPDRGVLQNVPKNRVTR